MNHTWQDILPRDRYRVTLAGLLHYYDIQLLNQLYQPLIGSTAFSLYMTLWQDSEGARDGMPFLHHHLLVHTQTPLKTLLQVRKKLEAVGLLKVYKIESEQDDNEWLYELHPPLCPQAFFTDGLLNIYLFNRVGATDYRRMKERFITRADQVEDEKLTDMTANFNDVFQSVHPSELKNHDMGTEEEVWPSRKAAASPQLTREFDFKAFYQHLSEAIISHELITKEVEEAIETLAFVYKLSPVIMCDIIQRTFLHADEVTIESLRKEVRTYYRLEFGDQYPALSERRQPDHLRSLKDKEPDTETEKQIKFFEEVSPFEILELHAGGSKPSVPDLKLVEQIMFDQHLNAGVMNVLLSYIMYTQDQKLNKSYVEKLAAHWARKKITTVSEAMALSRMEHQKYQQWSMPQKRTKSAGYHRSNEKKDVLPKWMESTASTDESNKEPEVNTKATEDAKWLEDYLNNL